LEDTGEAKFNLTWINRTADWFTLRANYSYLDRSGSNYNFDPYEFMYSGEELTEAQLATLIIQSHTAGDMRKYDVGERKQSKFDLMGTFTLPHEMTVYASVRAERNEYPAMIGRQKYDTMAAQVTWEWQPNPTTVMSAWYGYDSSKLKVANTNDINNANTIPGVHPNPEVGVPGVAGGVCDRVVNGVTVSGSQNADGVCSNYPDGMQYWYNDKGSNTNAGFNFRKQWGNVVLDLDWGYIDAKNTTGWDAESAASFPSVIAANAAGLSGVMPNMQWKINSFTASLQFPVSKRVGMRIFGTWEKGDIYDWHYDGFDEGRVFGVVPTVEAATGATNYGNLIYADGGYTSYSAWMAGLMIEVKL
jgi:hypothetical protein